MNIEINPKAIKDDSSFVTSGGTVLVTPPLNEDFWLMRVRVSEIQSVVIFPKFGVIGCGFQFEDEDWNTNLPISCKPSVIAKHIWKNHRNAIFSSVVEAITLLQTKCLEIGLIKQSEMERMAERI